MANIMTGAEINRTITGNTYTLEEINFIRGSELSARHLATLFNVTIENIHYVRNRANSIEKLLRSHKRIRVDSDNPLAPPKGDPDKMCGCCSCIITKTNKDLDIVYENDVTSIYVTLSQEDTLALTEGTADIQARFIGANGKAPATKIKRIKINRVLLNKVITYGNNPT